MDERPNLALSDLHGQRLVVWGAGREGRSALNLFRATSDVVLVVDDPTQHSAVELAQQYDVELVAPRAEVLAAVDVIVRSPGVSRHRADVVAAAERGVPSTGLVALWLAEHHEACVVGVTGTKGKSTTSALTQLLLASHGADVALAGNIGTPITDLDRVPAITVLEVSSYQAADVTTSPRIGVLTSLGSDHLPWHRNSDECYRADKLRLFSGSGSTPLIVNGRDETAWTSTAMLSGRVDGCAGRWRAVGSTLAADGITIAIHDPVTRAHNATNVLLALTAAEAALGRALDPVLVERTLADFRGLPARQQQVAVVDGVAYIDDAIASNPMGAIAALDVFDTSPLVVIIGGTDRNVDIAALVDRLAAVPELRAVITLADLGARVADETERRHIEATVVRLPDDVATAVATAAQLASSGDTVLFSPAAATTPAVGTYLDRSRLFVDAVARLL